MRLYNFDRSLLGSAENKVQKMGDVSAIYLADCQQYTTKFTLKRPSYSPTTDCRQIYIPVLAYFLFFVGKYGKLLRHKNYSFSLHSNFFDRLLFLNQVRVIT